MIGEVRQVVEAEGGAHRSSSMHTVLGPEHVLDHSVYMGSCPEKTSSWPENTKTDAIIT